MSTQPLTPTAAEPATADLADPLTDTGQRARSVDRRMVLAGTGVGCAVLLAACSSGGSGSSGSDGSAGSGSSGAGSGGGSSAGGSGQALAALSSIKVGSAVSAQDSRGNPIIVARPSADAAVAFSAICTHQGCTVAPAGSQLDCPCHGSRYSATTGKVLGGPAPKPLPSIPVTVRGGQVFES